MKLFLHLKTLKSLFNKLKNILVLQLDGLIILPAKLAKSYCYEFSKTAKIIFLKIPKQVLQLPSSYLRQRQRVQTIKTLLVPGKI